MNATDIGRALAACRTALLAAFAFSLCTNVLTLASPIYMMQLYDHVLSSRSTDTLVMLTIIVIAALLVLSVIDALRRQLLAKVGHWLEDRLEPPVLAGALRLALRNETVAAGGLRDVATLRSFLSGNAVLPLFDAPWSVLYIAALFLLHPVLGLIGLSAAVLLFALAVTNEFATRSMLGLSEKAAAQGQASAALSLRNAEVVQAMGMAEGVITARRRETEAGRQARAVAGRRGDILLAVSKFSRLAVQTAVMGAAAWLAIRQDVSPAAIFAGSFLLSRALAPVENAVGTWKSVVAARMAYARLKDFAVAAAVPPPGMELPRPEGALHVEQVTYRPAGAEAPVLRGVSFALAPGEVLGVLGASAAGKTTLARLIAGSLEPTAGTVRLDGADIRLWHASGGGRHLGYLPQDIELFPGSVRANIARLGDADAGAVIDAARLVGLHETIMRLPRGYDSDIGDGGLKLSGGQRQRVGLARALFGDPRLIVLDEPNSSLDHEGELALLQAIAAMKARGATVVIIAHRPSVLSLADKLLVLRNGAVEAYGARTEIFAKLNVAALPSRPSEDRAPRQGTG